MMMAPGPDPVGTLRELLAAGRYQEVLDRHTAHSAEWVGDPGAALAVATAATRLGRLDTGARLADDAFNAYRRRADNDGRLRCLNLLGAIAWERGALDVAASRWSEALEAARASGDTLLAARTANNLASALHLGGDDEEPQRLYREALLAYHRLADRRGLAETEHNLALAFRDAGELERAHEAGERAVRHAELVGDPVLLALVLAGRAETRFRQGVQALARHDTDRAERLAGSAGDRLGVAEAQRVGALGCLLERDPGAALERIEPARRAAESLGSALLQADCADVARQALGALGRAADARERLGEARRIYQSLGAMRHLRRLERSG